MRFKYDYLEVEAKAQWLSDSFRIKTNHFVKSKNWTYFNQLIPVLSLGRWRVRVLWWSARWRETGGSASVLRKTRENFRNSSRILFVKAVILVQWSGIVHISSSLIMNPSLDFCCCLKEEFYEQTFRPIDRDISVKIYRWRNIKCRLRSGSVPRVTFKWFHHNQLITQSDNYRIKHKKSISVLNIKGLPSTTGKSLRTLSILSLQYQSKKWQF